MGYETKIYVCDKPIHQMVMPEIMVDKTKPLADGSGYEAVKDDNGKVVYTGRKEQWLNPICSMELGKISSTSNDFGKLLQQKSQKYKDVDTFYFIFADDGNTHIHTDKYGDLLRDYPITTVLEAAKNAYKQTNYIRFKWLVAMLEPIAKDIPEAICLTYGH